MNNANSENSEMGGILTPNAQRVPPTPRKKTLTMRRRPTNGSNNTVMITAPAPVPESRGQKRGYNQGTSAATKRMRPGGLVELARQRVQQLPQAPVRMVQQTTTIPQNNNDNLRPENVENVVELTNKNYMNRESYFDELAGLLQSYTSGYQRIHRERNGRPFVLPNNRTQEQRDADARRDFGSLLGYIDRVEQDYIIPDSIADFVKSIRKFKDYKERVDERWMNKVADQIYPLLEDFKKRLGKQTVASLGPAPAPRRGGGKRQRYTIKKLNRRRRRRTHRQRK
jgi:hypothetical protein